MRYEDHEYLPLVEREAGNDDVFHERARNVPPVLLTGIIRAVYATILSDVLVATRLLYSIV